MARLLTTGFESGAPATATPAYDGESDNSGAGGDGDMGQIGTVSYQNSIARVGGWAMKCDPGAGNYQQMSGIVLALDSVFYVRFYIRVNDITPSGNSSLQQWRMNGLPICEVRSAPAGHFFLEDANSTQIGSTFTPTVDTWHMIEVKAIIPTAGAGTLEWRVDGTVISTSTSADVNNSVVTPRLRLGHLTGATETTQTVYIDDVAVNDATGANQNDYPGPGHVTLLTPSADNAKGTGWEGPQTTGSDTTNLFVNVGNIPPVGVAHADTDANTNKYIFNAANLGAASEYRATCLAPFFFGVPDGSAFMLSQAYMRASCNDLTGTNNMELQGITPADSAVTCNVELTAVAGTEPVGWKSFRTIVTYRPSMTINTAPIVEATKILTGVTRAHMVDQMGLLIEWRSPVERSASFGATVAIESAGEFETPGASHERSAAIAATAAIESAGVFWTEFQRSGDLSAASAIATAHSRNLLRAAQIAATAAVGASALTILERSASISSSAVLEAAGQRDLQRAVGAAATCSVEVAGSVEHIFQRAASIDATAALATAPQRDLLRQAAIDATATVTVAGEIEGGFATLERSAAIDATTAITTAAFTDRPRSASIAATAAITVAGEVEGPGVTTYERSAAISSTVAVTAAAFERELERPAEVITAATLIATSATIPLKNRSAAITATSAITTGGALRTTPKDDRPTALELVGTETDLALEQRSLTLQITTEPTTVETPTEPTDLSIGDRAAALTLDGRTTTPTLTGHATTLSTPGHATTLSLAGETRTLTLEARTTELTIFRAAELALAEDPTTLTLADERHDLTLDDSRSLVTIYG